jgi:hypothetical protein
MHETVGGTAADRVTVVEPHDLLADTLDAEPEVAHLLPVTAAIAIARPRLRIILSGGGRGDCQRCAGGDKGKNDLTHHGSPSNELRLMR